MPDHRRKAAKKPAGKRKSPTKKTSSRRKLLARTSHCRDHKRSGGAPTKSATCYKIGAVCRGTDGHLYRVATMNRQSTKRKKSRRWISCPKGKSRRECSKRSRRVSSKKKKPKTKHKVSRKKSTSKKQRIKGGQDVARRLKMALFGGQMPLPRSVEDSLVGG